MIEITGLRTHENLLRLIDPAILKHAVKNDAAAAATEPTKERPAADASPFARTHKRRKPTARSALDSSLSAPPACRRVREPRRDRVQLSARTS